MLVQLYNKAWAQNWGFVPMTEAEAHHLVDVLKFIFEYDLIQIAELEGRMVGFMLTLPDYNQVLAKLKGHAGPISILKFLYHRRRITRARVCFGGVDPEFRKLGLNYLLIHRTGLALLKRGITNLEMGWFLEENALSMMPGQRLGAQIYKRYLIYEGATAPS